MSLTWQEQASNTDDNQTLISAHCAQGSEEQAQLAVNETIEKAIEIVPLHITDDSVYMIFEWCADKALLTVSLSDETKANDSSMVVHCELPALAAIDKETLRFWVRDYLTTCDSFMHFSLIAVFHTGDRSKADLL